MTAAARKGATMQPSPDVTAAFLRNYWRHVEGGWVTLFSIDRTTGDRATHWAETERVVDLANVAANLTRSDRCVWFGAATRHEKLPNGDRGAAKDCDLFPGLWVDIDIAGPAHERADLCRDEAAAHALINAYGLAPTVVIHSGWGLQAWWMLAEPITLGEAASILPRWGATWIEIGRAQGVYVDNVFDPARVMRVPGTCNHKVLTNVRPVTVLSEDWTIAWGLDDIEPTLREAPVDPDPAPRRDGTPYVGATRPGDAFNARHEGGEILERFGWTLDRTDRTTGDRHYVRPGKQRRQGSGATVYANDGHTAVYTTSVPGLQPRNPYKPFGLYAALAHGGDHSAAARTLAANGYGSGPVKRDVLGDICDPERIENMLSKDDETEDDKTARELLGMLVDWDVFWADETVPEEWLVEPVIPAKRSISIHAPGGTGKSLLALYLAANAATGRPVFGLPSGPKRRVLYLDYEMTDNDLRERLESFGFGPSVDMSNLRYALLPSIAPLDTDAGAATVIRWAELVDAELVIIDTFARAVSGDENEADTVRAFYRLTGARLKAAGRAMVRIDHTGKDPDKGARGTSAKRDDVDVVWRLTALEGGLRLKAEKRRMSWVKETIELRLDDEDDLAYKIIGGGGTTWPLRTKECADDLDRIGAPKGITTRRATDALRAAGIKYRRQVVVAAVRFRNEPGLRREEAPEPDYSGLA